MDYQIELLRENLPWIRRVCKITAKELGAMLGVSRQMISMIETTKGRMNRRHYLALRCVIEKELIPRLYPEHQKTVRRLLTERVTVKNPYKIPNFIFESDA